MSPRASTLAAALVALLGLGAVLALNEQANRPPPPEPKLPPLEARSKWLSDEPLEPRFEQLKPLHEKLRKPGPGEWLAEHNEPGQSVGEYLVSSPTRATSERRTLYVQPIGDFSPPQEVAVAATVDFLGRFYQLPVVRLPPIPLTEIPDSARRANPLSGQTQLRTTYIMQNVLLPRRPADAMAMLGLTAVDLFPADDWNFVFGEASLEARVGVWSLYRNGHPEQHARSFLIRTIKTAAHELGHQFSLRHCLAFQCVMNGSNSLEEADRQPMTLCPSCLAKLAWNIGFDPAKRATELAQFDRAHGFDYEAKLEARTAALLAADAGAAP